MKLLEKEQQVISDKTKYNQYIQLHSFLAMSTLGTCYVKSGEE